MKTTFCEKYCTARTVLSKYPQRHILYSVVSEMLSSYEYKVYEYMIFTVIYFQRNENIEFQEKCILCCICLLSYLLF